MKLPKKVLLQSIENEVNYGPVARRRAERRRDDRRDRASNRQDRAKKLRRIQSFGDIHFTPLRLDERRETERRQSKPSLLSAEDLVKLRKR